jgi:hypothetical protein
MDHLFLIYQEVKNNLEYFLKLFMLGMKEGFTPEKIINLLPIKGVIKVPKDCDEVYWNTDYWLGYL